MSDIIKGKTSTLPKIENCLEILNFQQKNIKRLIELKNSNILEIKEIENKLLIPLFIISESIRNMFKE